MEEADQSLIELVGLRILEIPHHVCHQETGDRHLEVLEGRLTREGEPEAGQEFSQIGKQMEHLRCVVMHAVPLLLYQINIIIVQ